MFNVKEIVEIELTFVRLGIEKNAHQSPITFMNVRINYKEQRGGMGVHAFFL